MNTPPPIEKPTQPDPKAISGAVRRVATLGAASEQLFARLYRGLNRQALPPGSRSMTELNRDLVRDLRLSAARADRFRGVLNGLNDGVIMQDNEGRLLLINPAAQRLLGSTRLFWQSELGTMFNEFRDVQAVESELTPLGEPRRITANNRVLGAQFAAIGDDNGRRIGTFILLRDVSDTYLSERLKDQFIVTMSHELRTPMAVIKGVGEVLAASSSEGQPLTSGGLRMIGTLSRNIDVLDRMIVELLDVSEMNGDEFTIRREAVSIEPLLWTIVRSLQPEIGRARLNVSIMTRDNAALEIVGDAQRLQWAIGHILQNAIRYTEADGYIIMTASRTDDGHMAIQVVDTGVGIADKDLPRIFERFYRGEPRGTTGRRIDPRGLGQGLFIARTVIEAHSGYIEVRSTPGSGSAFTIVLPRAAVGV